MHSWYNLVIAILMIRLVFLSLYIVLIFLRWHLLRGGERWEEGGGGQCAPVNWVCAVACAGEWIASWLVGLVVLAAILYSLVRATGHLSWLAAILVSDWWCFVGGNSGASYWMVLAAISGPLIGWLVLVAQFPSLLLVGQRWRSS